MSQTIKAIETRYKGYRFRSRLEARWAVFFDELGLKWEYEKQGYSLPSGPYLPDFWLIDLKSWFEVKGEKPTEHEQKLMAELVEFTKSEGFICNGMPPGYCPDWNEFFDSHRIDAFWPHTDPEDENKVTACWDNFHAFCICDSCGSIGIEFEGRSDRLKCKMCYRCSAKSRGEDVTGYIPCRNGGNCQSRCLRSSHGDKGSNIDRSRILDAIHAAYSARFEHGECGK